MKNTPIKIWLIITTIVIAVFAVLFYKNTVIDPPKEIVFINYHDQALSETISLINGENNLEQGYHDAMYMIKRYKEEKLMGKDTIDRRLEEAVSKYTPLYIDNCKATLKKAWDYSTLEFMVYRVKELSNLRNSSGELVISESSYYMKDFGEIEKTYKNYHNAKKLADDTNFRGLEDTKKRNRQANEYKNDDNLKNCKEIVDALNDLPYKIMNSHYRTLRDQCKGLKCYGINDYDNYQSKLYDLYKNKIPEFVNYYYYKEYEEIRDLKKGLVSYQKTKLVEIVDYAVNINNFSYYDDYSSFKGRTKRWIEYYLGNPSDVAGLSKKLSNDGIETEEDFKINKRYNKQTGSTSSAAKSNSTGRSDAKADEVSYPTYSKSVKINGGVVKERSHHWKAIKIKLNPGNTEIDLVVATEQKDTDIYSSKNSYIEDCETGNRYYIKSSSIGLGYENRTFLGRSYSAKVTEQYPPLPISVKRINIIKAYYVYAYDLKIR